jgi:hypothetical protein
MGKLEKLALQEVNNPPLSGGLGLPCVRSKADALFVRQTCRLLQDQEQLTYQHVKYWLGQVLRDIFPDMAAGPHAQIIPEYYKHMRELMVEAVENNVIDVKKLKRVVAKQIYSDFTETFPPPKIIYRYDINWEIVWKRLEDPVLDTKGREILFMLIHNIIPNRERLFRLNQVDNSRCVSCRVVEDNVHYFSECVKVREAWGWVRRRVLDLLPPGNNILSNWELLHLTFTETIMDKEILWLVSTFVENIWVEVRARDRTVNVDRLKTAMKLKYQELLVSNRPMLGLFLNFFD